MNNTSNKKRGRPKGTTGSHYINIKIGDLVNSIGHQGEVVVSKAWYEGLGIQSEDSGKKVLTPPLDEPRIQFSTID
jgi:hypothetical protein